MERKTGVEPAAFSLARRCSTTELLPLVSYQLIMQHPARSCTTPSNLGCQ